MSNNFLDEQGRKKLFKKIAVFKEHHQLIDQFSNSLKNQAYVDRVYG